MTSDSPRESATIWKTQGLAGLELLKARYVHQTFARHSHDGYGPGCDRKRGFWGLTIGAAHVVAPAGSINMAVPDEPHTGEAAVAEGWSYRMFYLETELLREAVSQMQDRPGQAPFFKAAWFTIPDWPGSPAVAPGFGTGRPFSFGRAIPTVGAVVRRDPATCQPGLLTKIFGPGTRVGPPGQGLSGSLLSGKRIFGRFEPGRLFEPISPDPGLSAGNRADPSRLFEPGPHQALQNVIGPGLDHRRGRLETGFVDQSHLTRQFKRLTGVTPGQYRRAVGLTDPVSPPGRNGLTTLELAVAYRLCQARLDLASHLCLFGGHVVCRTADGISLISFHINRNNLIKAFTEGCFAPLA